MGSSCSGFMPVGTPFLSGRYRPPKRPHENFEPAVLVEEHLGGARLGEHAHEKPNQYRFS